MTPKEADLNPVDERKFEEVEALARQLFGDSMDLDQPILGIGDNDIVASNIHEMIRDPGNTLATLVEDGRIVGFSMAVPIGKMNPDREAESTETAYIYFTGIEPNRQGGGLVGKLMEDLIGKLRERGYGFVERDCMLAQGYADSVGKAYRDAIVEQHDHTRWPEIGPERFFRIDLSRVA